MNDPIIDRSEMQKNLRLQQLRAELDAMGYHVVPGAMKWMISIEWWTVFSKPTRSRIGPNKAIWIIDEHPALYIANAKRKLHDLDSDTCDDYRADDIEAVYWAIELPDGLLTEDQVDSLS